MEISDEVLCLFSGVVEKRGDSYVIEVPDREVDLGQVAENNVYRVAVVNSDERATESSPEKQSVPTPPVAEGEQRKVDIEDIGEQGDGIARVERGYVLIVPDTEKGERVTAEVKDVQENVAFAEVVEREDYYE